ncbi:MAG: outer membrane insertion C- signal [Oscillospiraceae bacterium]|nr:outer membrane insertion C- signal [Oscillospiraceae bacterium]
MEILVYLFTGFLDSGKTSFIQETLTDSRFNNGERTLVLLCEEGEVELDPSEYPYQNVYVEVIEDQDALTSEQLEALQKKHKAERVVVELNGMKLVPDFLVNIPDNWVIAQEIMFADANTILAFNSNMRNLVVDKLGGCEMVVFNRVAPKTDIMPLHKLARAVSRKVDIVYDYTDGHTEFDNIEDPLPFDLNAPVIEIADEDYGLFYRDFTEESKKYSGKTVRFKAQAAQFRKAKDGYFAPGRFVMTCCIEDIKFMGIPCAWKDAAKITPRSWVTVQGKIELRYHSLYKGMGPVIVATSVEPAQPCTPDYCTF